MLFRSVGMLLLGIDFQRISLGALIIALGLLVDDAIIAVEMMMVKLEQGASRLEAATFAYTSTAFPMLTGTLVTAVGFVPVGFARSGAGEYTNSIFWVVGLSLIISWFVAVLFTPWMGYHLLPQPKVHHHDPYGGRLYTMFRKLVVWCVTWRKTTIAITALAFVASMAAFGLVHSQSGTTYYMNCEHPWSILYRDGQADFIENELMIRKLGMPDDKRQISIRRLELKDGDTLVLGSDGRDDLEIDGNIDADEIIVMGAGRILERGTHAALMSLGGVYAEMWMLQQAEAEAETRAAAE